VAIVTTRIQSALAQDPVKVKTTNSVAAILDVPKATLTKVLRLAPASVKASNGQINIAKLERWIRNNPQAASLLTGNSDLKRSAKKVSANN
jgi:hypothetical protein